MNKTIEQKKKEFKRKWWWKRVFEDNKEVASGDMILSWIEQALKEAIEKTVNEMLVEERDNEYFDIMDLDLDYETMVKGGVLKDRGFNQCCVLQKEKRDKIIREL